MAIALTKEQRNSLVAAVERELARRDFWCFCKYMDPEFFRDEREHLVIAAEGFQEIEDGITNKLAISMPPRAGKSYITSLFIAWRLGKHPRLSNMRNSYAASLAEKFSYDIRSIITESDKYRSIFPLVQLKGNRTAIQEWAIKGAKDLSYFCAGIGGPITGKGCEGVAVLDDPIKNWEEACSTTAIEKAWNWYGSTHRSRFEGCAEINIATRWSKKDPIGRLIAAQGDLKTGGKWRVIVIPALNSEGESFCPSLKTTEELLDAKELLAKEVWEAEYMQNPIEAKGLLYPDTELTYFTMKELKGDPDGVAGFTDTADKGTDYLASVIGQRMGELTYITEVYFTQDPIEVTEAGVAQLIINTQPDEMTVESNNGGRTFGRNVKALIKGKSPKTTMLDRNTTQNKETRILMKSGYIKKNFRFRTDYKTGSDYDKFMLQLCSYMKAGKNDHDDAADALTGLAETIVDVKRLRGLKA